MNSESDIPFFDEDDSERLHDAHVECFFAAVEGYDVWFGDGPMRDVYPKTCRACDKLGYSKWRVFDDSHDVGPALVFGEHDTGHGMTHFIVCGDCGTCGPWAKSQSKAFEKWVLVQ
jgi:hypothetical protein